jgi:cytochrome c
MKKTLSLLLLMGGLYACGGNSTDVEKKPISNNESAGNSQIGETTPATDPSKAQPSTDAAATSTDKAAAPAGKDGLALIEGSDCRTCHKNEGKMIGPAYKDVAKKYENNDKNVKMLAEKIIKGGQGNWGEIPMAGHPNVSQADAEAMVRYILTIK